MTAFRSVRDGCDATDFADGTLADPPTLRSSVQSWQPSDTIPLGRDRTLRVVATRLDEGTDGDPVSVLVVADAH